MLNRIIKICAIGTFYIILLMTARYYSGFEFAVILGFALILAKQLTEIK